MGDVGNYPFRVNGGQAAFFADSKTASAMVNCCSCDTPPSVSFSSETLTGRSLRLPGGPGLTGAGSSGRVESQPGDRRHRVSRAGHDRAQADKHLDRSAACRRQDPPLAGRHDGGNQAARPARTRVYSFRPLLLPPGEGGAQDGRIRLRCAGHLRWSSRLCGSPRRSVAMRKSSPKTCSRKRRPDPYVRR